MVEFQQGCPMADTTGWRRCIGCLEMQVSFRKRATNYRSLLRKLTIIHTGWQKMQVKHEHLSRHTWVNHYFYESIITLCNVRYPVHLCYLIWVMQVKHVHLSRHTWVNHYVVQLKASCAHPVMKGWATRWQRHLSLKLHKDSQGTLSCTK